MSLRFALLTLATAALVAGGPDGQAVAPAPVDRAASLLGELGITAQLKPGKAEGRDLDEYWRDPAFSRVAPGETVVVYLYDATGKAITPSERMARLWADALLSSFRRDGVKVGSDEGFLGNSWEYPFATLGAPSTGLDTGRMILNTVAGGGMSIELGIKERTALSPEEAKEESEAYTREIGSLGKDAADAQAAARAKAILDQEMARLRHELLGGIKPTNAALLWDKERDTPLFEQALARDAHRHALAEADSRPYGARGAWVLVGSLQIESGGHVGTDKTAGTVVLFHDGKPVAAAHHANKMATALIGGGFGQMFTGKGAGLSGVATTNGEKLAEAFHGIRAGR